MTLPPTTRRSALRGAGVFAVATAGGYLLARPVRAKPGDAQTAANAYGPVGRGSGRRVAGLVELQAGTPRVYPDDQVVLLRGPDDTVTARSAICTHQGCLVGVAPDGQLLCPCHGSRFDAHDGAVVNGPANRPLPPVTVVVRDGGVWTGTS